MGRDHRPPPDPFKPETRTKKRRAVGTKIICAGGGEYKIEFGVYESYAVVTERIERATAKGEASIELHRPDDSQERTKLYYGTEVTWHTLYDWNTPGLAKRVMLGQIITWEPRIVS